MLTIALTLDCLFVFFFLFPGLKPRFSKPIQNVTVMIGRDAILKCVVDNLGKYKVSSTLCN